MSGLVDGKIESLKQHDIEIGKFKKIKSELSSRIATHLHDQASIYKSLNSVQKITISGLKRGSDVFKKLPGTIGIYLEGDRIIQELQLLAKENDANLLTFTNSRSQVLIDILLLENPILIYEKLKLDSIRELSDEFDKLKVQLSQGRKATKKAFIVKIGDAFLGSWFIDSLSWFYKGAADVQIEDVRSIRHTILTKGAEVQSKLGAKPYLIKLNELVSSSEDLGLSSAQNLESTQSDKNEGGWIRGFINFIYSFTAMYKIILNYRQLKGLNTGILEQEKGLKADLKEYADTFKKKTDDLAEQIYGKKVD